MIFIDLKELYGEVAKLSLLPEYIERAVQIAHALHGKAKKLIYLSPVTGDVVIFDHDPY